MYIVNYTTYYKLRNACNTFDAIIISFNLFAKKFTRFMKMFFYINPKKNFVKYFRTYGIVL